MAAFWYSTSGTHTITFGAGGARYIGSTQITIKERPQGGAVAPEPEGVAPPREGEGIRPPTVPEEGQDTGRGPQGGVTVGPTEEESTIQPQGQLS